MRINLRARFATIRWRLTFTYVLVSALFALTLLAIIVAALAWLLNSTLLLNSIASSTLEQARALGPELQERTPDAGRIAAQLRAATSDNASPRPDSDQTTLQLQATDSTVLLIAVLDASGRVITATAETGYARGELLTSREPGAHTIIRRALAGTTDPAQLGGWHEPGHQPVAAVPVLASDGRVLGAVYLRLSNFPTTAMLLQIVPPLLLTVVVPWTLISIGVGAIYAWVAGRGLSRRLKRLTDVSAALAGGDLSRRVDDRSADEIGQLGQQFNAMADQLGEHMRALHTLAEQNAALAERAAQLASVEERNRLARDLHDSVSQELFSVTMLAAAARRSLDARPAVAAAQIAEAEQTAHRALQETRSLIFALRPAALDDRGLAPALRDLAAAAHERQGLEVQIQISGERRLPLEHEQALFRITQEALANIARHSGQRSAAVALCYGANAVQLSISDAGRGFAVASPRGDRSFGLHSMAERAAALGGRCTVESAPGAGTSVRVELPVG